MWCQEVDLHVGAGRRAGRDICDPTGRWVKPAYSSETEGEWEDA